VLRFLPPLLLGCCVRTVEHPCRRTGRSALRFGSVWSPATRYSHAILMGSELLGSGLRPGALGQADRCPAAASPVSTTSANTPILKLT
jgi:hypothetical protein